MLVDKVDNNRRGVNIILACGQKCNSTTHELAGSSKTSAAGRAATNSIADYANISLFEFGLDSFAGRFGSEFRRMRP
jgi:hypothetical protein